MKNKFIVPPVTTCLSISEEAIKLVQSRFEQRSEPEISCLQSISLKDKSDQEIIKGLNELLQGKRQKDLGRFILLIPRQLVSLHYCRLPSRAPEEIKEMARLQAVKHLPYEPGAIILAYQAIRVTDEGYSDVVLVIAHHDIIRRYLKALEKNKLEPQEITVDSQGIYHWFRLQKDFNREAAVTIIDLDSGFARLDILSGGMSIYSRAFALSLPLSEYKPRLLEEIRRSFAAHEKEGLGPKPAEVLFTGGSEFLNYIDEGFLEGLGLKCLKCRQEQNVIFKTDSGLRLPDLEKNSFAAPLGMAISREKSSLNLLPGDVICAREKIACQRQMYKAGIFSLLIIVTITAAMFWSISLKQKIKRQLSQKLQGLSQESERIEKMAQRLNLVRNQLEQSHSCLDVLSEVFRVAGNDINLIFFGYDDSGPLILKGQAKTLSGVFNFVNALEASNMFQGVQVRHSSKRKLKDEEAADFEIISPIREKADVRHRKLK